MRLPMVGFDLHQPLNPGPNFDAEVGLIGEGRKMILFSILRLEPS
jgi:hypothetical protein